MNNGIKKYSISLIYRFLMNNLSFLLVMILIGNFPLFAQTNKVVMPYDISNLLCFWSFQDSNNGDLVSRGRYNYKLKEMNGPITRLNEGIFGQSCLKIKKGQWLMIKREDCPGLNIYGNRKVTLVAWINRTDDGNWQYIAGMWNERDAKRQYALFTCGHKQSDYKTLERIDAKNQAHGYVSDVGGATPDRPYCFSYATGKQKINIGEWNMVAFTYDQKSMRVYFNGELDENGNYNPFFWNKPIFDGGKDGSDFTVAQRALPQWPGYPDVEVPTHNEGFSGLLGGLAVYDRALDASEIKRLHMSTMLNISIQKGNSK